MRSVISLWILLHVCSLAIGQRIKAKFRLNTVPDNGTMLKLSRNKTFRYYSWSGWSGDQTIDSGRYVLKSGRLILKSVLHDSLHGRLSDTLYLKTMRLKKHEYVPVFWTIRKNRVFYKKWIILTTTKFDVNRVYSIKPKRSIQEFTLHKDSSLVSHIKSHELSCILISDERISDTCISEFRLTDRLKVVRVKYDPFYLLFRYQVGNTVYYTWYDDKMEYHSAVLDLFTKKKIITRKERDELIPKIKSLL